MTKTIVLSEEKQTVLATLYLVGVREITVQGDDIALWMKKGYFGPQEGFGGNIPFISECFSFEELKENPNGTKPESFRLDELILKYCSKYHYVLESSF